MNTYSIYRVSYRIFCWGWESFSDKQMSLLGAWVYSIQGSLSLDM